MHNIKIKICGITSVYDARLVSSFPVHAIGLNFVKRSKRKISTKVAREIIDKLPAFIEPVAVFEDEKLTVVMRICNLLSVKTVQLHGQEPVSYCKDLKRFNKSIKIIKAFPTRRTSLQELSAYKRACDCFLLDSFDRRGQMGGTGKPSDWTIAQEIVQKSKTPVILAGGLDPENILKAINRVKPYGIDVNSGVESRVGKKDKSLLEKLFEELEG